jgi:hypothetical protein
VSQDGCEPNCILKHHRTIEKNVHEQAPTFGVVDSLSLVKQKRESPEASAHLQPRQLYSSHSPLHRNEAREPHEESLMTDIP